MDNIPKICHLFWDHHPMSIYHTVTVTSFHKHNPDWRIIVWVSKQNYKEIGENNYVGEYNGKDHFDLIKKFDFVEIKEIDLDVWGINTDVPSCSGSDIFRMKVLYKYGGVYSDFDVLWVKPITHLKNIKTIGNVNDFDCSVCFYDFTSGFQNVSIIIAQKGSEYLELLMNLQDKVVPPYRHQSYGSELVSGAYPTLESIKLKNKGVLALEYKTLYPFSIFKMKKLYREIHPEIIDNSTIAVHWFCGHKLCLDFLNKKKKKKKSTCSFSLMFEPYKMRL